MPCTSKGAGLVHLETSVLRWLIHSIYPRNLTCWVILFSAGSEMGTLPWLTCGLHQACQGKCPRCKLDRSRHSKELLLIL
ncbi:hypothetical protein GOP47_0024542 [Adiantum capillus-veneris]|uniref:Uncharacterized protein n=1 Tax=Adiantum capillus-veneris TaxID=13818 RepID=A0A9D4U2G5_ADICA|nr:hypothetical protein GOP47_0024542 [Adiantum capillus-veneris]